MQSDVCNGTRAWVFGVVSPYLHWNHPHPVRVSTSFVIWDCWLAYESVVP